MWGLLEGRSTNLYRMTDPRLPDKSPSFRSRLSDALFVRHGDQTVVAAILLTAILGIGFWWWQHGGARGRLVDYDRLPTREAQFVVNVNTAEHTELAELPGVGDTLAQRMIDYRREHGPFRSLNDLKQVKGIGEKTLEHLTPHVSFGK